MEQAGQQCAEALISVMNALNLQRSVSDFASVVKLVYIVLKCVA